MSIQRWLRWNLVLKKEIVWKNIKQERELGKETDGCEQEKKEGGSILMPVVTT